MKKWIKGGLIVMSIHLLFRVIPDFVYFDDKTYKAFLELFEYIGLIYEAPLLFIQHIFNFTPQMLSAPYLIFTYIFGSLLYFCIGAFIAYFRVYLKQKKPTNPDTFPPNR